MSWRGRRSSGRCLPIGRWRCTGRRSPRWSRRQAACRTRSGWRITPKRSATARGCCGGRPRPRSARPASGAHREAAAQYARALRFADGLGPDALAELLQRRAEECRLTNEFDDAIDALERALALGRELGDKRRAADTLASLALVMHDAGRAPDAEALVSEAVELAEPLGPSRELARAYAGGAHLGMVFEDLDRTVAWGERAIELAETLNDTEILVHALTSVGPVLLKANHSEGRAHLERALRLALETGLDRRRGSSVQQSRRRGPQVT